jgi:hypothetical protein
MSQVIEHLPSKSEALSSNPSTAKEEIIIKQMPAFNYWVVGTSVKEAGLVPTCFFPNLTPGEKYHCIIPGMKW